MFIISLVVKKDHPYESLNNYLTVWGNSIDSFPFYHHQLIYYSLLLVDRDYELPQVFVQAISVLPLIRPFFPSRQS